MRYYVDYSRGKVLGHKFFYKFCPVYSVKSSGYVEEDDVMCFLSFSRFLICLSFAAWSLARLISEQMSSMLCKVVQPGWNPLWLGCNGCA